MHHKRSKMKPEEELPSPGAVSIQVRKADVKKYQQLAPTLDILHLPMPMLRFRSGDLLARF